MSSINGCNHSNGQWRTELYHFGTDHGECNVHIIRYLRKNTEETGHKWSVGMKALLCEMNRARKKRMDLGENSFPEEILCGYEKKYMDFIASGRKENKQPGHRYAKTVDMKCTVQS